MKEEKPEVSEQEAVGGDDAAASQLEKVPPMEPALEEDEDTNDAMEQGSANTTATAEEELEPKPEPMDQSSAALEPKIEPDAAPTADDNKAELGET